MTREQKIYCKIGQAVVNTAMFLGISGTFLAMFLLYIFQEGGTDMDEVKEFEDYLKGAFKRIHADKKENKIEFVVRLAENENKIYEKKSDGL